MLSVSEARDRLLAGLTPLDRQVVRIDESLNRVLAEDVRASIALPPFDNSAMDGYAVRAADVRSATLGKPVVLEVSGDIPAGIVESRALTPGAAMRIMTGAMLPDGADAVVPVESTSSPGAMSGVKLPGRIEVLSAVRVGEHVRRAGGDVQPGQLILQSGVRLGPPHIGMLASLGIPGISVYRKPRVALLSTGDELVEIDQPLRAGQIHDGNGYALAAAARAAGGTPLRLGIVPDRLEAVVACLEQALAFEADLIVSSAGVSLGAFDFVRAAIEREGHLEFWRVNIRPGKPFVFGSYRNLPFVGLPGNPVSALVTFEVFVRPMLDRMSGLAETARAHLRARLAEPVGSDGRESYLRAIVTWDNGSYQATLAGSQDSGVLSSLVRANALIVLPAGSRSLATGEEVEIWLTGCLGSMVGQTEAYGRENLGVD
jgi:molybdopterin molybdotransferase